MASYARAALEAFPRAAESGVVIAADRHDADVDPTVVHFRATVTGLIDDALVALALETERAFLDAHAGAPSALLALAHDAEEACTVEELSLLLDRALALISDAEHSQ